MPETTVVENPAASLAQPRKVRQQVVRFAFFKVMQEWRRLPRAERAAHKQAFREMIEKWNIPGQCRNITYSTVGLRGDADFCIWTICYSVDELNQMMADLMATPLGGYVTNPYHFLSMTKRSQYSLNIEDEAEETRSTVRPGGQKYIFIYPFWKTRSWYQLSLEERKVLMDEHIRVGMQWPRVKLNTTYSFGLDDQEFVVAFECNYPEDFLDLVQRLRETGASAYTLKDTPMFSCIRMTAQEMLDRIG